MAKSKTEIPVKRAIVVLGMHRSATSAVAGCLVQAGLALPKTLIEASEANPKGHFESTVVARFNDRVLKHLGSVWYDWRTLDPEAVASAAPEFRDEGAGILADEFGGADRIVLKDPRICRLVPVWRAILDAAGYGPDYVLPVRRPAQTARSLAARNGFSYDTGLLLWLQHVLAAERETRGMPRHTLLAEDLVADPARVLTQMLTALELEVPQDRSELDSFVEPGLLHGPETEAAGGRADIADLADRTYGILAKAARGKAAKAGRELDERAADFARCTEPMLGCVGDLIAEIHRIPGARMSVEEIIANGRRFRELASQRNLALSRCRAKNAELLAKLRALKPGKS